MEPYADETIIGRGARIGAGVVVTSDVRPGLFLADNPATFQICEPLEMIEQQYLQNDWFPQPLPSDVEIGPRSWLYSIFAFVHYHSRQPVGLLLDRTAVSIMAPSLIWDMKERW